MKSSLLDLPTASAPLQWWYFNAHLRDLKKEKDFSFFSSFFFQNRKNYFPKGDGHSHACTWALIDVGEEKYYADSLLDKDAPAILVDRLEASVKNEGDSVYLRDAVLELAKKGRLPRPDRVMKRGVVYKEEILDINYDDECLLSGEGDGSDRKYKLYLHNPTRNITANLEFTSKTDFVLHGEDGYVNNMFYYYYPSMSVKGQVTVGDSVTDVEGDGWYDREFGGTEDDVGTNALDTWSWFSLHLSDGYQLSLFDIYDSKTRKRKEIFLMLTSNGKRELCYDVSVEESEVWTSLVTFAQYPLKFHIEVSSLELSLDIRAAFKHQEFTTVLTSGSFYEGRVVGEGNHKGTPVSVTGFYERKIQGRDNDAESFLRDVAKFVRKTLADFYPLQTNEEWIAKRVLGRYSTGKGVLPQTVCDVLFRPVRSIIDRGGKAWRSLVLVSGCNALVPDYFDCTKYIAIAELLHVGSLIIDDIQDGSLVRRGGKTVHIDYGIPTAINAGSACYFMAVALAEVQNLSSEKAKLIYDLYFDVMKAGHVGQGLDIRGLYYLMPDVVRTGNSEPLLDALQAIHTYKTGCGAAAMCRVACILCDMNEEVSLAMESFGLGLGLAFQIVDDALNIKGFEGDLKEAGEDIREGKITYPVAKAMGKLELSERERIWTILQECPSDYSKIKEVVDLLNSVNAIDDCLNEAKQLIDDKWEALDPFIEDSLPKIIMRTFSLFLIKRAY